jgi:hypothetical protein
MAQMKNRFRFGGLLAVLGLLGLAGNASAVPIAFDFTSVGAVTGTSSCGPYCFTVKTQGLAFETDGGSDPYTWAFEGLMEFYQINDIGYGFGTGPGLGWKFKDLSGTNNLFGSYFMTLLGDLNDIVRTGTVGYLVEGGSGLFEGATGVGNSDISLYFGSLFVEHGSMSVKKAPTVPPAAVPEPGATGVLAAGLGMLAFLAYRRRRAVQKY